MGESKFEYTIYIRTTPEELWDIIHEPEFTKIYWFQARQESEWIDGAEWKMIGHKENLMASGEVLEIHPPLKQVLRWRNEYDDELKAEGYSRAIFELVSDVDTVRLSVTHIMNVENSKFIERVSGTLDRGGWPRILSSLKSYVETGQALELTQPLK